MNFTFTAFGMELNWLLILCGFLAGLAPGLGILIVELFTRIRARREKM